MWRSRRRRSGCWTCKATGGGSGKRSARWKPAWRGGCGNGRGSWAVPAPAPLFSALLNYRYSRAEGQLSGGEALQAVQGMELLYAEERTNYPCTLSVDDRGEGFSLTAQVQAPIEPERVCELMHTALERLIEALERAPGRALRSLQVLPERERQRVLVEWNASRVEYARHECVHEVFEAQAERTPEAVAVVYEASQLSYGELNRRANRVAHYL